MRTFNFLSVFVSIELNYLLTKCVDADITQCMVVPNSTLNLEMNGEFMKKIIIGLALITSISSMASDAVPFPNTYMMLKSAFELGLKNIVCPDEKLGNLIGEIRYADDTRLQLVFSQSIAGHKIETVLNRNWPKYTEDQVRHGNTPQRAFEQWSNLYSGSTVAKTIEDTSDAFNLVGGQSDDTFVVGFKTATLSIQTIPHCSQYNSSSMGCVYVETPILSSFTYKNSPRQLYTGCHVEDGGIHTLGN